MHVNIVFFKQILNFSPLAIELYTSAVPNSALETEKLWSTTTGSDNALPSKISATHIGCTGSQLRPSAHHSGVAESESLVIAYYVMIAYY